jgi:FkbM family methyltransferase
MAKTNSSLPLVTLEHPKEDPEEVYVRKQWNLLRYRLQQLPVASRAKLQGRFTQELLDQTFVLETPRGSLSFVALGKTGASRALKLLTRQPATIEWIDSFRPNTVFWDIGANIGVYALYAALQEDIQVIAFEPAAVNYFILTANCEANAFDSRVQCLLLGLGDTRSVARLEVSQFASAMSFSFHGKRKRPYPSRQAALLLPIDQLIEDYGLACPNYIKIDVPGLTQQIIAGAAQTLRREELLELHVEMGNSPIGQQIKSVLAEAGFTVAATNTHGSVDVTFVRQKANGVLKRVVGK